MSSGGNRQSLRTEVQGGAAVDLIARRWRSVREATVAFLSALTPSVHALSISEDSRPVGAMARHIVASAETVLAGIERGSFSWDRGEREFGTLDWSLLLERASGMPSRLAALLDQRSDSWLGEEIEGLSRADWLWQAMEHEIHHRAQISTILRHHGVEPPRLYS